MASAVTHKYSSSAEDLTHIFKSGRLFRDRRGNRGLTEKQEVESIFFTRYLSPKAGDYTSTNANAQS